jgi:dTDP-4-amino-4,6-dideoxygalactose transaminase
VAVAHQNWIVSQYEKLISLAGYSPLALDSRFEPVLFKYPLLSSNKKEIFEKAPEVGIELSYIFASPLYPHDARMAARWKTFGYRQGMCPISEGVADRIVAMPIHRKIKAKTIEKTIAFLASFQQSG